MRLLNRTVLLLACCLAVSTSAFAAEDTKKAEKPDRPMGTWIREAGGASIAFHIKADTLTVHLKEGEQSLNISAAYSVTGDILYAYITKVERAGIEGGPAKGDLFAFTYKTDKNILKISDLKTTRDNDEAKRLVEGDYKKK